MSHSWEEAQQSLAKEKSFLFTNRKKILLFPGLVRSEVTNNNRLNLPPSPLPLSLPLPFSIHPLPPSSLSIFLLPLPFLSLLNPSFRTESDIAGAQPSPLTCGEPVEYMVYDFLKGIARRSEHKSFPEPEVAMIFKKSDAESTVDLFDVEMGLRKAYQEVRLPELLNSLREGIVVQPL